MRKTGTSLPTFSTPEGMKVVFSKHTQVETDTSEMFYTPGRTASRDT